MENEKEHKYVIIPLSLIKRLYTHPETAVNDLFDMGIKYLADHIQTDLTASIKQVIYSFYTKEKDLTFYLRNKLEELKTQGLLNTDSYYRGFSSGEFSPDTEISNIEDYIQNHNDQTFAEEICKYYKIRSVKHILQITFNTSTTLSNLRQLKLQHEFVKNDAMISVKIDMLFDFMEHKKTQYEIEMLACYLGIRSILGKKEFVYTTKKYIACRMIGVKSPAHLSAIKNKKLLKVHEKYSKRYHIDKMLDTLVDRKFIVKLPVPHLRRIYFSTRLNLEELGESIYNSLTNNKQARIAKTKEKEKETGNKLLSKLAKFQK